MCFSLVFQFDTHYEALEKSDSMNENNYKKNYNTSRGVHMESYIKNENLLT